MPYKKIIIYFTVVAFTLIITGQVIPRTVLAQENLNGISDLPKTPFTNYAVGTTTQNYLNSRGSFNTGISIKNTSKITDQNDLNCLYKNENIAQIEFNIHGWFGIPYKTIIEQNCSQENLSPNDSNDKTSRDNIYELDRNQPGDNTVPSVEIKN